MKPVDKRRNYIEAACKLLQEEGIESVSARKIAAITGTVPSAIYRHFQSVDELMVYASIRYRHGFYLDVDKIAEKAENNLEMYKITETQFANFAFSNPTLFDNLVFGAYSDDLPAILKEYIKIFPETPSDATNYSAYALGGEDFYSGNIKLLRGCMQDGSLHIAEEELYVLNDILVNMFKGFLKTALDRPDTNPQKLAADYIRCFERILCFYLP